MKIADLKTYAFKHISVEPKKPKGVKRYSKTARTLYPREQWIEIPRATPAIIDEATFAAAQQQFGRNPQKARQNQKPQYLLRGHIRSGECGRVYHGLCKRNYFKYRCFGYWRTASSIHCRERGVGAIKTVEIAWEQIKNVLLQPDIILTELERRREEISQSTIDEVKLIVKRTRQIDIAGKRVVKLFRYGEVDENWVQAASKELQTERAGLQNRLDFLRKQVQAEKEAKDRIGSVKEYCALAARNIEDLSFEEQQLALEELEIKVIVKREGIAIEGMLPVCIASHLST